MSIRPVGSDEKVMSAQLAQLRDDFVAAGCYVSEIELLSSASGTPVHEFVCRHNPNAPGLELRLTHYHEHKALGFSTGPVEGTDHPRQALILGFDIPEIVAQTSKAMVHAWMSGDLIGADRP
jgi:hypothetical protein